MKVFVFEHLCGGGMACGELTDGMAEQGMAMLWSIIADFQRAGAQVLTTLDSRLTPAVANLEPTRIGPSSDLQAIFDELAMAADVTVVIAPESRGVLMGWLCCLQRLKAASLNCDASAASTCGDKLTLARALQGAGVPTPATQHLGKETAFVWPCVIKPRFGAGCEHTWICRAPGDLNRLPQCGEWIVQPYIPGRHTSCALLVHGRNIRTLPPGDQFIEGNDELHYDGGRIPLEQSLAARARDLAYQAVAAVPGLQGFVGVDIVLGNAPADDMVIEINPRMTMSYIGLRALCEDNIAAALLDPEAPLRFRPGAVRFDHAGRITVEARA
jgi:tyramine---L-glutamate ligase